MLDTPDNYYYFFCNFSYTVYTVPSKMKQHASRTTRTKTEAPLDYTSAGRTAKRARERESNTKATKQQDKTIFSAFPAAKTIDIFYIK